MLNPLSEPKAVNPLVPTKPDQTILAAAKGSGLVFAGSIFENGMRFVIGVLIARLLGANQLGLYNLTLTAAETATGFALLGLNVAVVRYVALYAGRRDDEGVSGILQASFGIVTILSLLLGIGLYVLADPIALQMFHEPKLAPLLTLGVLLVPFLALNDLLAAATQGFKKMQYTVIAQNIAQPLIRFVLIAALAVLVSLNARRVVFVYILANIATCILFFYFLRQLFSLKFSIRTARDNLSEMLRFSLPIYLSDLIGSSRNIIQIVLVGALSTVTNVGIFAVATQVNILGRLFYGAVALSSTPIIAQLYDRGERDRMASLYQTTTKWTFTVNLPLFLIVIMFPVPILSIFGQSFVHGETALVILAWANLVNVGTGICGTMLDMSGNTKLKLVNSVITAAATIGLNVMLIPQGGLLGAAIATLAAAVIVNGLRLLEVFILFRMLPYNLSFAKPITAGLVALVVGAGLLSFQASETNVIYIVMDVFVLLAVYGGMILLLGLSPEDKIVLARVAQRLKIPRFRNGW